MTSFEGRNDIPYNNSGGRCLLENWVEERAVKSFEPTDVNSEFTSSAQLYRHGHKGLLTTHLDATAEQLTTVRESYQRPSLPAVCTKGKKGEMLERMLYNKIRNISRSIPAMSPLQDEETHREFNPPPPPMEFISTKRQDFDKPEFKSTHPPPTMDHNVNTEQCITFWSTHKDKIHGVSQVKTQDTPFKKNSAFSKPISECLDQPKPYEEDEYPNM